MVTLDFTLKAPKPASPARHLDSTVRAVDAARDLIVALRLCEKVLNRARGEVDEEGQAMVSKMSQHLYCAGELAKQLQRHVDLLAQERVAFWNACLARENRG
jgi:hypothetical protein